MTHCRGSLDWERALDRGVYDSFLHHRLVVPTSIEGRGVRDEVVVLANVLHLLELFLNT